MWHVSKLLTQKWPNLQTLQTTLCGWVQDFLHWDLFLLLTHCIPLSEYSLIRELKRSHLVRGAAIAQWIHLHLPFCRPRFKSQAHHLCFFSFLFKFVLYLYLHCVKNENKQKEAGYGPVIKKSHLEKLFLLVELRDEVVEAGDFVIEWPDGVISARLFRFGLCDLLLKIGRVLLHPEHRHFKRKKASVTRWLDYFSIFGHLQQWQFAQKQKIITKAGSKFCKMIIKPSKSCRRLTFLAKVSPNLVTVIKARIWIKVDKIMEFFTNHVLYVVTSPIHSLSSVIIVSMHVA